MSMSMQRRVPASLLIGALLLSSTLTAAWLFARRAPATHAAALHASAAPHCDMRIGRVGGFGHVRPLLSARGSCEAERLTPLKTRLQAVIQPYHDSGALTRASVYLCDLSDGSWMSLNGQERYEPGSLMKVATMLAALMRAESDPGFASERFLFSERITFPHQQYPPPDDLIPGRTYSLAELLRYSSSFSSNRAEAVLLDALGEAAYQNMLNMLGLPAFTSGAGSYPMSAPEYAAFFEALYNSSMLSMANSELALGLLGSSSFKQGLRAGIPAGVDVASKFGETGADGQRQLHEAALVYAGQRPYLIVVMTEGRTADELAGLLKRLSAEAYAYMTAPESAQLAARRADAPLRGQRIGPQRASAPAVQQRAGAAAHTLETLSL